MSKYNNNNNRNNYNKGYNNKNNNDGNGDFYMDSKGYRDNKPKEYKPKFDRDNNRNERFSDKKFNNYNNNKSDDSMDTPIGQRENNKFSKNDNRGGNNYNRGGYNNNNNNNNRGGNRNERFSDKKFNKDESNVPISQRENKFSKKDKDNNSKFILDNETREYLIKIENILNGMEDELDEEQKEILIQNAFKEFKGKEYDIACDKSASLILERIFLQCKEEIIVNYFTSFKEKILSLVFHSTGSRVLEAILRSTHRVLEKCDDTLKKAFNQQLFQLADKISPKVLETMNDLYASHVYSNLLLSLNGISKPKKKFSGFQTDFVPGEKPQFNKRRGDVQEEKDIQYQVPEEYLKKSNDMILAAKEMLFPKLKQLACQKESNEVLRSFFEILSKNDSNTCKEWIDNTLDGDDSEEKKNSIINISSDKYGSVFIESIIKVSTLDIYNHIYQYLRNSLLKLSKNDFGNHVVQSLILKTPNKPTALSILQELVSQEKNSFSQLIEHGKAIIIQKLLELSLTHSIHQKEMVKAIMESVESTSKSGSKNDSDYFIRSLLELVNNRNTSQRYSSCGAIIIQLLFKMPWEICQKPVKSFLSLSFQDYILTMSIDNIGSKVVEGFLDSPNIDISKKNKFIEMFNGNFVTIGEDRYGSYSIEKMFKISTHQQKQTIAQELMEKETHLFSKPCGRYVLMICQVNKYKKKKDSWLKDQSQIEKKRKLFSDIIDDDDTKNKSKNNESEEEEEEKPKKKLKSDKQPEQGSKKKEKKKKEVDQEMDEIDEIFNNK